MACFLSYEEAKCKEKVEMNVNGRPWEGGCGKGIKRMRRGEYD
jgi:hypothetical protein